MSYPSRPRAFALSALIGFFLTTIAADTLAQEPPPLSSGPKFVAQTGQQIYQTSCQGCHMADGKGAQGAAAYPALANNKNLAIPEYILFVITKGKSGMPGFRDYMSDEQIANVANYVRNNLGNHHSAEITADFVKDFSSK